MRYEVRGKNNFGWCVVEDSPNRPLRIRYDEVKQSLVEDEGSVALIQKAWEALEAKDLEKVLFYTNKCVKLYGRRAAVMQGKLTGYPEEKAEINRYIGP